MTKKSDGDDVWMGDKQWVLKRFMDEGLDVVDAERVRQEVASLHEDFRPDFLSWLAGDEFNRDKEIHGYSINRLLDEGQTSHVPGAFTFLSYLRKYPAKGLGLLTETRFHFLKADRKLH